MYIHMEPHLELLSRDDFLEFIAELLAHEVGVVLVQDK
jgi:hypothetical protein